MSCCPGESILPHVKDVSLALFGHICSGGVTLKVPLWDRCFITSASLAPNLFFREKLFPSKLMTISFNIPILVLKMAIITYCFILKSFKNKMTDKVCCVSCKKICCYIR